MQTDIHSPKNTNNSLNIVMDHVKIFWDGANERNYFRLDEELEMLKTTTSSSEASMFSLVTTPELHADGQFRIEYTTTNVTEASSLETNTTYDIVLQLNSGPGVSQYGPYHLGLHERTSDHTRLSFELRGSSSTLPELKP